MGKPKDNICFPVSTKHSRRTRSPIEFTYCSVNTCIIFTRCFTILIPIVTIIFFALQIRETEAQGSTGTWCNDIWMQVVWLQNPCLPTVLHWFSLTWKQSTGYTGPKLGKLAHRKVHGPWVPALALPQLNTKAPSSYLYRVHSSLSGHLEKESKWDHIREVMWPTVGLWLGTPS